MKPEHVYFLTAGQIFTLFFIMLGPLRLMGPFTEATLDLKNPQLKKLSMHATLIATVCLIIAGVVGSRLLVSWNIEPPVLILAAGIIFFIAALRPLIHQRDQAEIEEHATAPNAGAIAFGLEITPYGVATTIVLMSMSHDKERILTILACLLSVMLLNVLSMMFGRSILKTIGPLPMKILGAALGVLQLGLALQIIVSSLQMLDVF